MQQRQNSQPRHQLWHRSLTSTFRSIWGGAPFQDGPGGSSQRLRLRAECVGIPLAYQPNTRITTFVPALTGRCAPKSPASPRWPQQATLRRGRQTNSRHHCQDRHRYWQEFLPRPRPRSARRDAAELVARPDRTRRNVAVPDRCGKPVSALRQSQAAGPRLRCAADAGEIYAPTIFAMRRRLPGWHSTRRGNSPREGVMLSAYRITRHPRQGF